MRVWVKICGLGNPGALQAAVRCGADAVGVVFAPGRRRLDPDSARRLLEEAPPGLERVGVFVDEPLERAREVADHAGLDTVQLHGREGPDYCRLLRQYYRVIKTIPIGEDGPLLDPACYDVDALLLDTAGRDRAGGTGHSFCWRLVRDLHFPSPLVLAGGLEAGNVARGLDLLRPRGVDVSSGVERAGIKDPHLIEQFVQAVRRWERESANHAG